MSYEYHAERPFLFTENGQVMFLSIRDRVKGLLEVAGAVRMDKAITKECGDTWQMLACLDRLVELGELRELTDDRVAGQHRVFVAAK